METETKTETVKGEGPANYKHHACSIIAKSSHTHTHIHVQAAAAKITLTCPHFHLRSSMAKSTLVPNQESCQRKGQGAKLTLTGSMDSPRGLWHLAITGLCLGLKRNMWHRDWKEKKKQREKGRKGVEKVIYTGCGRWDQQVCLHVMHFSETCPHALRPTLFSILSDGQQLIIKCRSAFLFSQLLEAAWMAGRLAQGQINTSVHESCSPHTPKTIAGGL